MSQKYQHVFKDGAAERELLSRNLVINAPTALYLLIHEDVLIRQRAASASLEAHLNI